MAEAIASVVRVIEADAGNVGALSTGEAIAAALIFNRKNWLPSGYQHHPRCQRPAGTEMDEDDNGAPPAAEVRTWSGSRDNFTCCILWPVPSLLSCSRSEKEGNRSRLP